MRAAVRVYGGWFVALVGGLLCAIGWYGVSGEKYEARQIPYLASASIPGAALIIAGAVLIAARSRGSDAELRQRVAELHGLLVEAPEDGVGEAGASADVSHREAGTTAPTGAEAAEAASPAGGTAGGVGAVGGVGAAGGVGTAAAYATARSAAESPAPEASWLAVPGGARYHRPDCALIADKPTAYPVTRAEAAEQGLRPCPLCDPGDLGPAAPTPGGQDGAPSSGPNPSPDAAPMPPTDAAPPTPNGAGSPPASGPATRASVVSGATPPAPDTPEPGAFPTNHPSGRPRTDAPQWTSPGRGAVPAAPRPSLALGRRAAHPLRTDTDAPRGSRRPTAAAPLSRRRPGEPTLAMMHDDDSRPHAVDAVPEGRARACVARPVDGRHRTAPAPRPAPQTAARYPLAATTALRLPPRRTVSAAAPPTRSRGIGGSCPASPSRASRPSAPGCPVSPTRIPGPTIPVSPTPAP